jgi:hypothetical protein
MATLTFAEILNPNNMARANKELDWNIDKFRLE